MAGELTSYWLARGRGVVGPPSTQLYSLFASGEDGFSFSPFSDTSKLLLLANGSTGAVAADNDPVGLLIDTHSWAGASQAAILAAQPELLNPASWSMSVGGGTSTATNTPAGTLTLFNDGTNTARGDQALATSQPRTYVLQATQSGANSGALSIGTSQGGTQIVSAFNQPTGQTNTYYFASTSSPSWVRYLRAGGGTAITSAITGKMLPGNHAAQATTTKRPAWRANLGGSPYIQGDGVDDVLPTPFTANGTAFSLAIDVEFGSTTGKVVIGGGNSTGNKQISIGLDASGFLAIGWGTVVSQGSVDRRNTRARIVVTGDSNGRDVWVNETKLSFPAASGAPDGTGGALSLCAFNNNGTPQDFSSDKICNPPIAINRKLTDKEVTDIVGATFR